MTDVAERKTRPVPAAPDDLFDMGRMRDVINASVRKALEKGCPVARVIVIDGERIVVRLYSDGHAERLDGCDWRAWPDCPEDIVSMAFEDYDVKDLRLG